MIRLRALGSLDLIDSDGCELHAILVQPKRLALLVYLATACSLRFRRRDAVVALFWPELDLAHARGALRQAMRFLRAQLGPDVLINRGEEEIGVNPDALRCDITEFDLACDAADWRGATELYRGDLLSGVFVADVSSEFEQWLEGERVSLRTRAARAAWSGVDEAEQRGDLAAAAPWARRAVELSPDDESGIRRLIRILDRRGDRAGALRSYQDFRRRLAAEYGVLPSPETEGLVAKIRAREVQIWESPLRGWPPGGRQGE